MAFIEMQADLKRTNELLDRIARVGERFLLEAYNVRMGHCIEKADDPNPKEKASITYATDEEMLKLELEELVKGRLGDEKEAWHEEGQD
jgi:hypothetical protein